MDEEGTPQDVDPVDPEPDDPDGEGTPPDPDEPEQHEDEPKADPEDDESEDWKNLKKKYPTADEKTLRAIVAERYWDQTKTLSRLQRENEELRERSKAPPAKTPPEKQEDPPPPHPDLQEVDQRINRLATRETTIIQALQSGAEELAKLDRTIQQWKGRLEIVADHEKDTVQARIDAMESTYRTGYNQFIANRDRLDDVRDSLSGAKKERTWTEKLIRDAEAKSKSEKEKAASDVQQTVEKVDKLIIETAKAMGFPADPVLMQDLWDTVSARVTVFFGKNREMPLTEIDVPNLVKENIERYMKTHKVMASRSFAERSRAKAAVSGVPQRKPAGTPSSPTAGKQSKRTWSQGEIARRNLVSKLG
jgi:hypothetical protein